jgi:hypothetical protein
MFTGRQGGEVYRRPVKCVLAAYSAVSRQVQAVQAERGSLSGVSIPADYYTAVLIDTAYGRKIVLLQFQGANAGWWCKEYDANPSPANSP